MGRRQAQTGFVFRTWVDDGAAPGASRAGSARACGIARDNARHHHFQVHGFDWCASQVAMRAPRTWLLRSAAVALEVRGGLGDQPDDRQFQVGSVWSGQ
jgi:hypothetical protein